MAKKRLSFETSVIEYSKVNSGFAKVKVLIMTHEQVANGTHFTKEVINKKRKGLNYLPVVGQFKEDDFGTHGEEIEISDDGDVKIIKETKPYGVVMTDSSRWENIQMKNGETVEYLVADAYLWIKMYPELEVLYEGKANNQSMEIEISKGGFNEDDWVYEVDDFEFLALAILGKSVLPAYKEAKIDVNFNKDNFKADYQDMVGALDKYLANYEQSEVEQVVNEIEVEEVEVEEVDEVVEAEEIETVIEEVVEVEETEEEIIEEETETKEIVEEIEVVNETDYRLEFEKLQGDFERLQGELDRLREFKSSIELEEKQGIIDTFKHRYSLEDEDIKDVIDNIDAYSAKKVEDELCIIAFKKGGEANFSKKKEKSLKTAVLSNYNNNETSTAGVKAILQRRK